MLELVGKEMFLSIFVLKIILRITNEVFEFEEYLADTITENFYDVELIEYSTEKYDHKRGFTTLTAEVEIPL